MPEEYQVLRLILFIIPIILFFIVKCSVASVDAEKDDERKEEKMDVPLKNKTTLQRNISKGGRLSKH